MNIFDGIEKLITEHGSAAVLSQQLAFARDRFGDLERKVSELQHQNGRLEAQLEREVKDREQVEDELQKLREEHSEEIKIHRGVEFRKGKRTAGKWAAFCPKCHMPAVNEPGHIRVECSDEECRWYAILQNMDLEQTLRELEA